jgi:hypothetical protein
MKGLTPKQLKQWGRDIFQNTSNAPRHQWMTYEMLNIFYDEFGHRAFINLIESCQIVTCENGLKFIQSKITE